MQNVEDEENPFYMETHETVLVSSEGIPFYESEMVEFGLHIEESPPTKDEIIIQKANQKKRHHY